MSQIARKEYLEKMRNRYASRTKKAAKSKLIDEFCEITGYERKYAIKLLANQRSPSGKAPKKAGRSKVYGEDVVKVLFEIWRIAEQPCGKRLKSTVKLWLPAYERRHEPLNRELREKLYTISPAQMDRVLAPRKVGTSRRKPFITKSNATIKALVPIRAKCWDVSEPGWIEGDTVAHCGGHMNESFIWSLTATDIYSGWTEVSPSWNRGQYSTCNALKAIEGRLPFAITGIDTDNGSEFLNHHVHTYFTGREAPVEVTRSRPYHKNDQAYVEQKNHTHVRQLLGYDRLEFDIIMEPMKDLLEAWSVWNNFFSPTLKQIEKRREGSKLIRRHEKEPKTPCDRLIEHWNRIGETARAKELSHWRSLHDPFELKEWIEGKLSQVWELQNSLKEAADLGELGLDEVAAPILGANPRSAPIVTQNRERLVPPKRKSTSNKDAVDASDQTKLAA